MSLAEDTVICLDAALAHRFAGEEVIDTNVLGSDVARLFIDAFVTGDDPLRSVGDSFLHPESDHVVGWPPLRASRFGFRHPAGILGSLQLATASPG